MEPSQYYHHNISPYIFTVSQINFDWVNGPIGYAVGAILIALLGFLFFKRKQNVNAGQIDGGTAGLVFSGLSTATIIAVVFYVLKLKNVEWGLRWYSTMYLLAFIVAYVQIRYWVVRRTIMLTQLQLDSLIGLVILGMILGARTFYVFIYNFDHYSQYPMEAIKVWEGGLSFHGGIVGVIIAIVLFCRANRIPFFHLTDKLVLTVPFGIAIGRLGNFMNGELYGRIVQSHVPWAVVFPEGGPQPRHPSQIYQSLGEGVLFGITLFLITRRKGRPEGLVGASFVFFYGFYRFFNEFFREADKQLQYYFNNTLTMGQILCLVQMLVTLGIFWYVKDNMIEGSEPWKRRLNDYLAERKRIENV